MCNFVYNKNLFGLKKITIGYKIITNMEDNYKKLLLYKNMYRTLDIVPDEKFCEDIDLEPVQQIGNIYIFDIHHLGDWVFDSRLLIGFDSDQSEIPIIHNLIESIELVIGGNRIELHPFTKKWDTSVCHFFLS